MNEGDSEIKRPKPDDPPWLVIALAEQGVEEVEGPEANPRIVEYDSATTLKATSDEVAWCSAFANWCMAKAGIAGTGSAGARSWLHWGVSCEPRRGAVAVFRRGNSTWQGHVGFVVGVDSYQGTLQILGGNQGDAVCVTTFSRQRLLGCRWPG